jgi:hypothetical protein
MTNTGQAKPPAEGGQGFGGGEQYERLEGSLTDGGALPGQDEDDERRFGAGRDAAGGSSPSKKPDPED